MKLIFSFPGPLVSSNRASRIVNGRAVKSSQKRNDEERIYSIVFAEAKRMGWTPVMYASVEIEAVNTRLDADNLCKVIMDSIEGIAYFRDSRVHRLLVTKTRDEAAKGERFTVKVEAL